MADSALAVARSLDDQVSLAMALWISSATRQVLGDVALAAQHAGSEPAVVGGAWVSDGESMEHEHSWMVRS